MEKIYVTKSFLPRIDEYEEYVKEIFDSCILTNQGIFARTLENKLKNFLQVAYLHYVSNGTVALQLALKALGIEEGEIITTPFTYVATTSSILWERCSPVFVDIEAKNFTIDVNKIEEAITPKTKAIMPVHVFGYACDVNKIQNIADKYGLKVIYDGAHAFGCKYKGRSLLSYGDVSTCSFHATKLFHTIEGGACITEDENVSRILDVIRCFGHDCDEYFQIGINAKQSEFHAAMGLANFKHLDEILRKRKDVCELYDKMLGDCIGRPRMQENLDYNYAYYPVLFKNEQELLAVFEALNQEGIFPRRYFYPSLNRLPYLKNYQVCPISEDISSRVACLPLYPDLKDECIIKICRIIKKVLIEIN